MNYFDKLKKSLIEFKNLLTKSNYGPKGYGQYTESDNVRRKMRNVSDQTEGVGPNKNPKKYSPSGMGSAKQQAAREERQLKAKNNKQPVKIFSPEEIKELEEKRKLNKGIVPGVPDGTGPHGMGIKIGKKSKCPIYDESIKINKSTGQWELERTEQPMYHIHTDDGHQITDEPWTVDAIKKKYGSVQHLENSGFKLIPHKQKPSKEE